MRDLRILFLGASKRVSLLERFEAAAATLGCRLSLFSFEASDAFVPISHLATVIAAPRFEADAFQDHLAATIRDRGIDVVIPNMDAATVALSRFRAERSPECWCVVSTQALTTACAAKDLADALFARHGIARPLDTPGRFPKIIKPVKGFGGKGIRFAADAAELAARVTAADIVQDVVPGQETTADLYFSPTRGLMGAVLRDRIEVSDGEVMACRIRPPSAPEAALIAAIAAIPGWEGCINVQYMCPSPGAEPSVIEINPRFGGGSTAAIEAGLDMPAYILAERLGLPFDKPQRIRRIFMTRARRDFFTDEGNT